MAAEVKRNCSWCFSNATHQSEGKKFARTELFHCMSCMQKTKECKTCVSGGMARAYEDKSNAPDKDCFLCMGLIIDWGSAKPANFDKQLPCSNCFATCGHKLRVQRKNIYECRRCQTTTSLCVECKSAMAKDGSKKCAKCAKLVSDWADAVGNMERNQKVGYCSVCITNGPHSLVEKNSIERDLYCCCTCKTEAKLCSECKKNFVKTGSFKKRACLQCLMENPEEKRGGIIGSSMNKVTGGRTNQGPVRALVGGIRGMLGRDKRERSRERGRRRKGSQERERDGSMGAKVKTLRWEDLVQRKNNLYQIQLTNESHSL